MNQAIAAYKNGTYSLIEACRKYKISEEHFRLYLEEDSNNEQTENEIVEQGNIIDEDNLKQEYLLEEGDLTEYEHLIGQKDLIEEGILIEEEYLIEQDSLEKLNLKEEINKIDVTQTNRIAKSQSSRRRKQKWTKEEMQFALKSYKSRACTYNEVCAHYGISKKEFKKQLLAFEKNNFEKNLALENTDSLKQENLLEEGNITEQDSLIEEEILIEEEYLIEQDNLGELNLNGEINKIDIIPGNRDVKSQSSSNKVKPKWTEEEMQKAIQSYMSGVCTFNEACMEYGITKQEFKKHLLAYGKNKVKGKVAVDRCKKLFRRYRRSDILRERKKEAMNSSGKQAEKTIQKANEQQRVEKEILYKPQVVDPLPYTSTYHKRESGKTKAEKKLATYIVNLQEGMFDVKAADIRRLAFQLFEHCKTEHRFISQKQEAERSWYFSFLAKNQQINQPSLVNPSLTKEYLFQKTNEHFDALAKMCTEHKLDASRIYNVEISKFSDRIMLIYCASALGDYVRPMIILKESDESKKLMSNLEFFDKCFITVSPSGKFTQELFVTWLQIFIACVHPKFNQKVVLCLDEYNTKCKYLNSIQLAHDNGIVLMQVPTCGSVRMQPLMMTLIRTMHYHYTKQVEAWYLSNFEFSISLKQSIEILLNIYKDTATTQNAAKGFKSVGIWPLNRNLFVNVIMGAEDKDSQVKMTSGTEIEEEKEDQLKALEKNPFGTPKNSLNKVEGRSVSKSLVEDEAEESVEFKAVGIKNKTMRNTKIERIDPETTKIETADTETRNGKIKEPESRKITTLKSDLNGFREVDSVTLKKPLNKSSTASTDIDYENEQEVSQQQTNLKLKNKSRIKSKKSRNIGSLNTTVTSVTNEEKSDQVRSTQKVVNSIESTEDVQDLASDIPAVRFCRIHCTACDVHIGSAPSQITNMFEHPKLRTLLCLRCYEFYGDGDFEQGDDQTDMFCRWCANGGNLYCCSFCSNTFCSKCVKRNFDTVVAKKIEDDEKWKCFVCDETDLYSARSLCRAIIQHVQTVSRILQNDKTMTAAEIQEKMNLDESRCCNRKRKRKRRRTGSASEDEDDETYTPLLIEVPQAKKRRTRKSGIYTNIHTNGSINNQSDDDGSLLAGENDLLPAMIPCEQTMTEGETALPFGTPAPVPASASVTLTERIKPPLVHSNNSKINPIPTINLLKPVKVRRLTPVGPISQTPISQAPISQAPISQAPISQAPISQAPITQTPRPMLVQKRPNRPMVSIPQPQAQQKRARVILPKSRPVSVPVTPKIIDLESDSDEAIEVVGESGRSTRSSKRQQDREDSEMIEISDKTFEQLILGQKQDIDLELQSLRKKFNTILSESSNKTQRITHGGAALKMKQFQQVMRKALYRLAQINDRVVREYQSWKKQQLAEQNKNSERMKIDFQPTKDPNVSLEMICCRDSESEDEGEDKAEGSILEASNLEADQLDCYNNLTLFRKKRTMDQGVGSDLVQKENKSIQVYDICMRDYEKYVGYSLLMKAEYDPKTEKEVLKPVEVLNEHFGKFQEQYIFHLQHIEENGIKTHEDLEDLPDPNETPLKDLIEANSPFIAEMLENIAPTVTNGSAMETEMIVDETPPGKDNILGEIPLDVHTDPTIATSKAVEELVKMVTKLSDELKSSNNSPENNEVTDGIEETSKEEKTKASDEPKDEETILAVRTLIEEESSNDNDFSKPPAKTQAMKKECNFLN